MRPHATQRYLDRLRARERLLRVVRDLILASASLAVGLVAVALLLGATPHTAALVVAWVALALAVLAPLIWVHRRDVPIQGANAARLLQARAPQLAARARSAAEFDATPTDATSKALVDAHARQVAAALAEHPPAEVIPWRRAFSRDQLALLSLTFLAGIACTQVPSVRAGLFALTHPESATVEGHRVASFVRITSAQITPPTYLATEPYDLGDASTWTAPRGSALTLRVSPLVAVRSLELVFQDGRRLPITDETRFLISERGQAHFVARTSEGMLEDATTYWIEPVEDRAPLVRLTEPSADGTIDPLDFIILAGEATDDVALRRVEFVITTEGGEERRIPIVIDPSDLRTAVGVAPLTLADFEVEPGEPIVIVVEAEDGDDISGPHITRSAPRTLVMRSEDELADHAIETLEAMREGALDLLADRIEVPVEEELARDEERFTSIAEKADALINALNDVSYGLLGESIRATDRGIYGALARDLATGLTSERRAQRNADITPRQEANTRGIRTTEQTVITLSSLLLRARADDAANIARELESLRREMTSLLAELRRNPTPEAMRRLMGSLARARRRVDELRSRMAQMGEAAPQEFENLSQEDVEQTDEALSRMQEALEGDDLDAAAQALTGLEQEIDALARALGQSQEALAEERFGERERAMADVIDRLMSLEGEQRELASRSAEARSSAAERAIAAESERAAEAAHALQAQASAAARALDAIDRRSMPPSSREQWDSARARLRDVETALEGGDLGEARRMAERATESLDGLERDLALDSIMFPGHDGRVGDNADAARQGAQRAESLAEAIERAIPDLAQHLGDEERAQLRGDETRQASAREATAELEQRLGNLPMGDSGQQITEGLQRAVSSMREAEAHLGAEHAFEAARSQGEAAQRLTEVRRQIEMDQQNQSGGGDGPSSPTPHETVVIPGAGRFEASMEERRRLLDAMQESGPSGFSDAVRRYYEGLLR